MKIHPAAEIFPLMDSASINALANDIKANGQREWIVLWKGQLLDGRNRLKACEKAGVEPETSEIEDDNLDPIAYVLSANLHRRHLTESQRAMVAARIKKQLEPAAKERKKRKAKSVGANLPQQNGKAREQAAKQLNVGSRSVDHAASVIEHGSQELVDAVDRGEIAVSKAAAVAKEKPKDKQLEAAKEKPAKTQEKTAFDHLRDWWGKANDVQKTLFRDWIERNP